MKATIARLESRADTCEPVRQSWDDARGALRGLDGWPDEHDLAVLANALALAHFDCDEDVHDLRRIAEQVDRRTLALRQEAVLAAVDVLPGRPMSTQLLRNLGERAWGKASRTAGTLTHDCEELRELCAESALRMLMVGAGTPDPTADPGPEPASEEELLEIFRTDDLVLWRNRVSAVLADPWAGHADRHLSLLAPHRWPAVTGGIRAIAAMARQLAEEDERRAVADHIRATIAGTGLTQREFAGLVGTSPSRLSTYVTGTVTPSAAMLLRINRTARRARGR